jgi:dTDP-4-amino-4,6-dideoxygalactose transaminase
VFVVRCAERDRFQAYLRERGIDTLIHYPIPPHRQRACAEWNALSFPVTECIHDEVLSLPVSPVIDDASVDRVIEACNAWR